MLSTAKAATFSPQELTMATNVKVLAKRREVGRINIISLLIKKMMRKLIR